MENAVNTADETNELNSGQNPKGAEKKAKLTQAKMKEYLFVASILAIPIAFFLVFWVYVNFRSLLYIFQRREFVLADDGSGTQEVYVFSLENFKMVFSGFFETGELSTALLNTVEYYLVAVIIVLPVSILMAYFVYKRIPGHKLFRTVTYLPNIITSSALVVLFRYTFMKGGPINAMVGETYQDLLVGGSAQLLLLLYSVIFGFGANMVVLGGAMNSIDKEVLEAGEIDGCTWFQELRSLILPMIWPTISTILVLSLAGFLSSTGPILALTNGEYNTSTLNFLLYGYSTGAVSWMSQDIPYASAIGFCMTVVTFPIVLVLRHFLDKRSEAN